MNISNLRVVTYNDESKSDSFYASYKCKTRNSKIHWHDFCEIHLISDGAITEHINGHKIEMSSRWIYFLKPYDVHEYWSAEPVSMYKIQFLIDILDPDIQNILISENYRIITRLSEKEYDTLLPFFQKIIEERNSNHDNRHKMISHLMNCLLIEMMRLNQTAYSLPPNSDTIVTALDFIHHNYTKSISMQQVAAFVGLTPNYFCSKFHKEIGQPFKQYLRGLQLNHAATLLRISDMSITNICMECGINSFAHFLRDFKEYYTVTPSQYRKLSKESASPNNHQQLE